MDDPLVTILVCFGCVCLLVYIIKFILTTFGLLEEFSKEPISLPDGAEWEFEKGDLYSDEIEVTLTVGAWTHKTRAKGKKLQAAQHYLINSYHLSKDE